MNQRKAFLGIDVGSISTKAVIIDESNHILAGEYIWTEGDPIGAVKRLLGLLENSFDSAGWEIVGVGATGSARRLVGSVVGATVVKNEITAHAIGTITFHPEVRTILEIGGQDSKIILVENGVAVDYAMNTLCAAGTGAFQASCFYTDLYPISDDSALFVYTDFMYPNEYGAPVKTVLIRKITAIRG